MIILVCNIKRGQNSNESAPTGHQRLGFHLKDSFGLKTAFRTAQDLVEVFGQFPAHQRSLADSTAETFVLGMPMIFTQGQPFFLGLNILFTSPTNLD